MAISRGCVTATRADSSSASTRTASNMTNPTTVHIGRSMTVKGITTTDRERPMWTVEGFVMFDADRVDAELLSARVAVTQPREIAIYDRAFSALSAMAVHGQAARALITGAIAALG